MNYLNELKEKIENANYVLVGIGEEFFVHDNENELIEVYNNLAKLLDTKNYYIVSLATDSVIDNSNLDKKKIVLPLRDDNDEGEKAWNDYLLWLSCTLNRQLLVLELGVLLSSPQVIRWPFEKTTMLNNKAYMMRINETLPNITPDIAGKAESIEMNALNYMKFEL